MPVNLVEQWKGLDAHNNLNKSTGNWAGLKSQSHKFAG
jgi:hypothetical protein